jgi:uncharacterized protein YqgC (DUF456 family)
MRGVGTEASLAVLVGLLMAVGVVGVVVPVLPGLALVWAAALLWALLSDGSARWVVLAVATVLAVVGTVARYALAGRSLRGSGAPGWTMTAALLGGVAGFFVIPVLGLLVGALVGALAAERVRLRTWAAAWASTRGMLLAVGVGMLVELAAALGIVGTWGLALVLRGP